MSWEPRRQRPEFWTLFNTRLAPGETMRVFPLSNWTELDVWDYIEAEKIPVVPLYFAKTRPVIARDGVWIMIDDDRLPLRPGETPEMRMVRFRTLGCYPLTGAVESAARDGRRHRRRTAPGAHLGAAGPADRTDEPPRWNARKSRGIFNARRSDPELGDLGRSQPAAVPDLRLGR